MLGLGFGLRRRFDSYWRSAASAAFQTFRNQQQSSQAKLREKTLTQSALLIGGITYAQKEWQELSFSFPLQHYAAGSRDDFIHRCRTGEYNDITAIYRSNEWTRITGLFDRELVQHLPDSLKFICHNGAGYDTIDINACTERGISVSSTPGAVNNAAADIAIFLMLGALRRIMIPLQSVRRGTWRGETQPGHDPNGRILGILGMGGIGSEIAKRARAFGMRIQYHNRSPLPKSEAGDAEYVCLDKLLRTSDVVSLSVSLNPSTQHIISKPQLQMMKDGVVIVNISRGKAIDEAALVDALDSGKVYSVGLDVYEGEPEIHPGLLNKESVVLLPHIAVNTYETRVSIPYQAG